jgi:hypothetical protein
MPIPVACPPGDLDKRKLIRFYDAIAATAPREISAGGRDDRRRGVSARAGRDQRRR